MRSGSAAARLPRPDVTSALPPIQGDAVPGGATLSGSREPTTEACREVATTEALAAQALSTVDSISSMQDGEVAQGTAALT